MEGIFAGEAVWVWAMSMGDARSRREATTRAFIGLGKVYIGREGMSEKSKKCGSEDTAECRARGDGPGAWSCEGLKTGLPLVLVGGLGGLL